MQQGFCKIRATEYRLKYICNSNRLLYLGRINEKVTAKQAAVILIPVLRKAPNVVTPLELQAVSLCKSRSRALRTDVRREGYWRPAAF